MVTDSRTEQELLAALDLLGSNAPVATAVLPSTADAVPTARKHPRRLTMRLLPLAAILVIIGVAVGIAFAPSSSEPPANQHSPAGPNSVVGVWWELQQVNGQRLEGHLSLDIGVHGTFQQTLGGCEWVTGELTVMPGTLRLTQVSHQSGDCPVVINPGPDTVTSLRRLLHGDLAWSVTGSTLRLHGSGVTATYAPHPGSGTPSRQWTYHGVGISVPASWPRNAIKCDAPTTSTVIYPHSSTYCYYGGDKTATTVEFGPIASTRDGLCPTSACSPIEIDGTSATEHFARLPDGRQVADVRVPSRNMHVTITSPDAALAAHLAEFEIYIAN